MIRAAAQWPTSFLWGSRGVPRRLVALFVMAMASLPVASASQDIDARTMALIHDAATGLPPAGSRADPAALADALKALEAERLLTSQRVAFPEPDVVDDYGRALLLGARARQFVPQLAEIRNAAIRRDRDATAAAIERLFKNAGRNPPDPTSMARYVDAVSGASAAEGPAETVRREFRKPDRTIVITDAKRAGLFTIEVTTTPPGGQARRTVLVAERTARPDASGTGLEQRAVPVRACSVTESEAANRRQSLNGTWTDPAGGTWEVSGSGESVSVVEKRTGKPPMTYTGTYSLGRIQATHPVGAANELGPPLPEWVRRDLVGKTAFVVRLDDCGEGRLQGTWESRHVTYDPAFKMITRIHDPYDLALTLVRAPETYRIASLDIDYRPWEARQAQLRSKLTLAIDDEKRLTTLLTDALEVLEDRQRRAQKALADEGDAKRSWQAAEAGMSGVVLPDAAKSDAYRALERRRDRLAREVERLYNALIEASTTRNPLPPIAFENHRERSRRLDSLNAELNKMAADAGLDADRLRAREASHQAFLTLVRKEGEFLAAAATVENAREAADDLETQLLKARAKVANAEQELARFAASMHRVGGTWVEDSRITNHETTIWEPKELLDFLASEIATLQRVLESVAEERRTTRIAFVSAREESIALSDRLRNGIFASAAAQGLTEFGSSVWDVTEKFMEAGPLGAIGETAKKVAEAVILGPPSFYEPTLTQAYLAAEGGAFPDVWPELENIKKYLGKRAVKTYGTSAAASIAVKKFIEYRSMKVYRSLINEAGTDGATQSALAKEAFESLKKARQGFQKAVRESLFRNLGRSTKASLVETVKQAIKASIAKDPKKPRKPGKLQEAIYKEVAKMAAKTFFAEWLEGAPLADFIAADAEARLATQVFMAASGVYWQVRDDYEARVNEQREVLRQYDPKNSMRIIADEPFQDKSTLRVVLRDGEGQWLKSAGREVAVKVGGKSATQVPGDTLIYSVEASGLSHDGNGGVALEVIVSR